MGLLTQLLLPLTQLVGSFQAVGEVAHWLVALLRECPCLPGACIPLRLDMAAQTEGIAHHKV